MLHLLLLRHAKSDWTHSGVPDHERPLNRRGRRDAPRIGGWLRRQGLVPAAALVSSARRTTETARLALAAASGAEPADAGEVLPPEARRIPQLYGASAGGILEIVRREAGAASPLLVVGHNPGMLELAARFRGAWGPFPTATLLVVAIEIRRWSDLNPTATATVRSFIRPRDLRRQRAGPDPQPA